MEVEKKLRDMGLTSDEITDVLMHLISHNFLNEERFAVAFAGGRYRVKGWGRKKIIYHLRSKGINQQLIDKALQQIPNDEYSHTLQKLIQKKDATIKETDPLKRKASMLRYLSQKGFESELIFNEVNKYYKL
jgi:regulatory protein